MKKREWTKERAIVALILVVVALFFGLVQGVRYPALVTWDVTYYPRDYDEAGDYRENTRCWDIPIIFWSCNTTLEANSAEAQSA